nr:HEAT repeat domain-containing protein [Xenococcaceae cyanobacterium MO_188.B29]
MSTKAYYLLSKVLIPIALVVGAIVPNLISSRLFAQTITSSVSSRQCEKANIKDSINKLETGDIAAFDFLVACDSKAVFSLIELLDDEDENLRIITIAILGEIGEGATNAIPFFEEILKDTQKNNEDSRLMVVNALEKMGQPAVPALITALQDDDYHVSYSAVGALSEIGQPAVPTLIAALQDEDYRVRSSAVGALGEIGKPAVPALIAALQDDDYRVRSSAVGALG